MKYSNCTGQKFDYNARIYTQAFNEYRHIYMDFFYFSESGNKEFTHDLSGFKVSCQIDKNSINRDFNPCYAIHFEYSDCVNTDTYKEVSKILKIVESGINAYRENYGYIESMGEFLTVICNVLGIKYIDYNNNSWKTSEIKGFINSYLTNLKENYYSVR